MRIPLIKALLLALLALAGCSGFDPFNQVADPGFIKIESVEFSNGSPYTGELISMKIELDTYRRVFFDGPSAGVSTSDGLLIDKGDSWSGTSLGAQRQIVSNDLNDTLFVTPDEPGTVELAFEVSDETETRSLTVLPRPASMGSIRGISLDPAVPEAAEPVRIILDIVPPDGHDIESALETWPVEVTGDKYTRFAPASEIAPDSGEFAYEKLGPITQEWFWWKPDSAAPDSDFDLPNDVYEAYVDYTFYVTWNRQTKILKYSVLTPLYDD